MRSCASAARSQAGFNRPRLFVCQHVSLSAPYGFFSTADRIAIGGYPFPCVGAKPTRDEALAYYRSVVQTSGVACHLYCPIERIQGEIDNFILQGRRGSVHARRVVLATGFFHQPVQIGCEGEHLSWVHHYFDDGHRYADQRLLIVGGANSAVIAALESWRCGAHVHLIHRGTYFQPSVKYWLLPDIENRLDEGAMTASFQTQMVACEEDAVTQQRRVRLVDQSGHERTEEVDHVLALTGYRADHQWLQSNGIELNQEYQPLLEVGHYQSTSRRGIFIAGCALCGNRTSDIFIENGKDHADVIAEVCAQELSSQPIVEDSSELDPRIVTNYYL